MKFLLNEKYLTDNYLHNQNVMNNQNKEIFVVWTGVYPCLCLGKWILRINGSDYSNLVPFRKKPANTAGKYKRFRIDTDCTQWETYEDGANESEWIKINAEWLHELPIEEPRYPEIYAAFQACDWRPSSCGGCI